MTRINTNVSALSAQKSLQRSQASLQSALTRLSTGLRINTGKDDPAGLIASEVLRADITSVETAISNSERANQVIATADSALGQVSALLNDIRGLVTEAANEGALSTEQIAANQLQIDSSLEAINRIAQTTTFQGRKLLDGSFDFITTATQNFDDIVDLEINQANLGATGQIDVEIEISAAATKAQITNDGNPNAAANATISFASSLQIDDGGTTDLDVWTTDSNSATYNAGGNKITLTVDKNSAATVANVEAAIANLTDGGAKPFAASASGTWANTAVANTTAGTDQLTVTAASGYEGPDLNNVTIQFDMNGNAGANPLASYSPTTNTLTISIASDETGPVSLAAIESTIDTDVAQFDASVSTNGSGNIYVAGDNGVDLSATGDTGPTGGGVLLDSLAFTLGGKLGVEVFSFDKYTKISKIVEAVNLVSDATGVTATDNDGTLELDSAAYVRDQPECHTGYGYRHQRLGERIHRQRPGQHVVDQHGNARPFGHDYGRLDRHHPVLDHRGRSDVPTGTGRGQQPAGPTGNAERQHGPAPRRDRPAVYNRVWRIRRPGDRPDHGRANRG